MWQEVVVPQAELEDLDALEKRLGGRIMNITAQEDGSALVQYAPVVDDSWFVDVWNGQATICIVDEHDFILYVEDMYEADPKVVQAVIQQVLKDYGIDLSISGQYYPISEAAQEAFKRLVETSQPKRHPYARR